MSKPAGRPRQYDERVTFQTDKATKDYLEKMAALGEESVSWVINNIVSEWRSGNTCSRFHWDDIERLARQGMPRG